MVRSEGARICLERVRPQGAAIAACIAHDELEDKRASYGSIVLLERNGCSAWAGWEAGAS